MKYTFSKIALIVGTFVSCQILSAATPNMNQSRAESLIIPDEGIEENGLKKEFVLYARPRGDLGKEMRIYWTLVRSNADVKHDAIAHYPPHVRLTDFFPNKQSDKFYEKALKQALKSMGERERTIQVIQLIQSDDIDYIEVDSKISLLAV